MASNPPIEALARADQQANPHANIISFIHAQLPYHNEYAAEGRKYLEPYLESHRRKVAALVKSGSVARSELHSEGSRESSSVRPRGVVARMRTREDISKTTPHNMSSSPPLITKKEMEKKAGKSKKENVVKEPAMKKQKVGEAKAIETRPRKSILKPTEDYNANCKDDAAARAKAVKKPGPLVSKAKGKQKHHSKDDAVASEPDRDARLEDRKTRRREKAAIVKPWPADICEAKQRERHQEEEGTSDVVSETSNDRGKTKPQKKAAKKKKLITAGMKAKTEKGMAMLAAFEACNIGGTGGRITVNPLRKGLFSRGTSSNMNAKLAGEGIKGRLRGHVPDLAPAPKKASRKRKQPSPSIDVETSSAASSESSALEVQSQSSRCKLRTKRRPKKGDRVSKRDDGGSDGARERIRQLEYHSPSWPDEEEEAEVQTNAIKAVATARDISETEIASEVREHDDRQQHLATSLSNYRDSMAGEWMVAPLETVQRLLRDVTEEPLDLSGGRDQHSEVYENHRAIHHQNRTVHRERQLAPSYEAGELGIASGEQDHHQLDDYAAGEPRIALEEHRYHQQDVPREYHLDGNDAEMSDGSSDSMGMYDEVESELVLQTSNVLDMFGTTADDVQRRLWRRRQQ